MNQPLLTRDQVRSVDAKAIQEHGIAGLALMENASRAVADEAIVMFDGSAEGRSVLVICGGGNNGGDGFAAARLLHEAGARVQVIALKTFGEYAGDAKTNLDRCLERKISVSDASDAPTNTLRNLEPCELIVDGILGTGLTSPVRRPENRVIDWINRQRAAKLAIDIPSGLDCDEGKPLGVAVEADSTVTFVAMKAGFVKANAGRHTGRVIVADIGTPPELVEKVSS